MLVSNFIGIICTIAILDYLNTKKESMMSSKKDITLAQKDPKLGFFIEEIHSHVMDDPFIVVFLSQSSIPRKMTIVESSTKLNHFKLANPQDTDLIFIIQMFCSRLNDDQKKVTQFLGSAVIDISQCKPKSYRFLVQDCSTQPHLKVGQIQIQFTALPTHLLMPSESSFKKISLKPHIIQSPEVARKMFSAAEENLKWIEGFSPKGLRPIVHGLHWVHSPYYVNHIGITLPSGAFCMIPTLEENVSLAVRSYKQRLQIALS